MVELFETRVEGQVNYMNFLEFVRECGTSSALDTLSKQLHRSVHAVLLMIGPVIVCDKCIAECCILLSVVCHDSKDYSISYALY